MGNPVSTDKYQFSTLAGDSTAYDGRPPLGDVEKTFPISGTIHCDLYVDVLNLFNWTNVPGYYDHYRADQAAWEIRGDHTGGPGIKRPSPGKEPSSLIFPAKGTSGSGSGSDRGSHGVVLVHRQ